MKAVLFDLDETLFDRTESMAQTSKKMAQFFLKSGAGFCPKEFEVYFQEADKERNKPKFARLMLTRFPSINYSIDKFVKLRDSIALENSNLFPGSLDTLKNLKDKGFKIGIVTNASRYDFQYKKIRKLGIVSYLDTIVISNGGFQKPQPGIFQKALRDINLSPESVVFVGDNPIADIEGAKQIGMKTIYKKNKTFGDTCDLADYEVSSINEVFEILQHL